MIARLLFSLAAAVDPAPEPVHAHFHYDTVAVAPGITSFVEAPPHAMVQGNATLIVGRDAALVIDSGHYPAVARRVIADIRALTDKPVRYLAVTHWHMDHYMANADYAEAWPGLAIVAQSFTASMMDVYGPRYLAYGPKLDKNVAELESLLARNRGADGKPLAKDRRARIQTVIDEVRAGQREFPLMRYRGADLKFETALDIDLGERVVQLRHFGRGNTAGDLVAWVPDARVLIAGDTVVHPIPFSYGSYLSEWPDVLQKMLDLDPAVVVPGHGPVMRDTAYVAQVRDLLRAVTAEVERVWTPGMDVEAVRKAVDLGAQQTRFCHGDKTLEANFADSILRAGLERAVQAREGRLKPEGLDD